MGTAWKNLVVQLVDQPCTAAACCKFEICANVLLGLQLRKHLGGQKLLWRCKSKCDTPDSSYRLEKQHRAIEDRATALKKRVHRLGRGQAAVPGMICSAVSKRQRQAIAETDSQGHSLQAHGGTRPPGGRLAWHIQPCDLSVKAAVVLA